MAGYRFFKSFIRQSPRRTKVKRLSEFRRGKAGRRHTVSEYRIEWRPVRFVLSLRFRLRRELAATWKSDQRPAWTNVEFAAATARRVQRTCTAGAKKAPDVRCLAAEVSVPIRWLFLYDFFFFFNGNEAYKRRQTRDTTFRGPLSCDYFSPLVWIHVFRSVCRLKYNNPITISITDLYSP